MDSPNDAALWAKRLAPYRKANDSKAVWQLVSTFLLFTATWIVMFQALKSAWWLSLLLSPLGALFLIRLFIFQHDCGHGSFFTSKRANATFGFFLGVFTLTPYHYWKRTHAIHHATSGNLDKRSHGDIDTLTVAEYLELTPMRQRLYRMYRNSLVLFVIGPFYQFFIKHRAPWDAPLAWRSEWISVLMTNIVLLGNWIGIWYFFGVEAVLFVQLPINLIAGTLGVWLFYVQHQFERTYWARGDEWDFYRAGLDGCSLYDLPSLLHWFTGSIGFHHIHHLASRIPNYSLQRCYHEVPELQNATKLSFWASLACIRFKLWDDSTMTMVGFSEAQI